MINHAKAKVLDTAKGPIVINGIGIKPNGELFLPRRYLRKIRGLIHLAMKRHDVNPAIIHGMMGVFFQMTPRYAKMNEIERALYEDYENFRGF